MAASSFDRLIRFEDEQGNIQYGDLDRVASAHEIEGTKVQLLSGNIQSGFQPTSNQAIVKKLLCPIESTPIFLCAGVNYHSHGTETKLPPPKKPVLFATPGDRLIGPLDDVPIPRDAQELLDYEGELTLVISKDGKDISESKALDYVLGYTIANDVTARHLCPPDVSGYQMGYSKSFDKFGPVGPCLVSPRLIPDPQKLQLTTKVNGKIRQDCETSKMVWSCAQLIEFASKGRTLRQGTVIMTGTPEGVGWFSGGCLSDGDTVEIALSEIGTIKNKMAYQ